MSTRYVIGPDVALALAKSNAAIASGIRLLAPTLLRSQVLDQLYAEARRGRLTWKEADKQLVYIRKLDIRLLGDRALQQAAWRLAERHGWPDTYAAEYAALTELQADALAVKDAKLRKRLGKAVKTVGIEVLLKS